MALRARRPSRADSAVQRPVPVLRGQSVGQAGEGHLIGPSGGAHGRRQGLLRRPSPCSSRTRLRAGVRNFGHVLAWHVSRACINSLLHPQVCKPLLIYHILDGQQHLVIEKSHIRQSLGDNTLFQVQQLMTVAQRACSEVEGFFQGQTTCQSIFFSAFPAARDCSFPLAATSQRLPGHVEPPPGSVRVARRAPFRGWRSQR